MGGGNNNTQAHQSSSGREMMMMMMMDVHMKNPKREGEGAKSWRCIVCVLPSSCLVLKLLLFDAKDKRSAQAQAG